MAEFLRKYHVGAIATILLLNTCLCSAHADQAQCRQDQTTAPASNVEQWVDSFSPALLTTGLDCFEQEINDVDRENIARLQQELRVLASQRGILPDTELDRAAKKALEKYHTPLGAQAKTGLIAAAFKEKSATLFAAAVQNAKIKTALSELQTTIEQHEQSVSKLISGLSPTGRLVPGLGIYLNAKSEKDLVAFQKSQADLTSQQTKIFELAKNATDLSPDQRRAILSTVSDLVSLQNTRTQNRLHDVDAKLSLWAGGAQAVYAADLIVLSVISGGMGATAATSLQGLAYGTASGIGGTVGISLLFDQASNALHAGVDTSSSNNFWCRLGAEFSNQIDSSRDKMAGNAALGALLGGAFGKLASAAPRVVPYVGAALGTGGGLLAAEQAHGEYQEFLKLYELGYEAALSGNEDEATRLLGLAYRHAADSGLDATAALTAGILSKKLLFLNRKPAGAPSPFRQAIEEGHQKLGPAPHAAPAAPAVVPPKQAVDQRTLPISPPASRQTHAKIAPSSDEILTQLDQAGNQLKALEHGAPSGITTDLTSVRNQYDTLLERALNNKPVDGAELDRVTRAIDSLSRKSNFAARAEAKIAKGKDIVATSNISDLRKPIDLNADTRYSATNSKNASVEFTLTPEILHETMAPKGVHPAEQTKFLKALQHGPVESGKSVAGFKRFDGPNRKAFEVKINDSDRRWYGCIENGVYIIRWLGNHKTDIGSIAKRCP